MFWQHLPSSPVNNLTSQKKAEAAAAVASPVRVFSQGWWPCLLCWPHPSCLQAQQLPGSQPGWSLCAGSASSCRLLWEHGDPSFQNIHPLKLCCLLKSLMQNAGIGLQPCVCFQQDSCFSRVKIPFRLCELPESTASHPGIKLQTIHSGWDGKDRSASRYQIDFREVKGNFLLS